MGTASPGPSSSEPSTAELLAFALDLADAADVVGMRAYRTPLAAQRKPDGTFVTPVDREVETLLRARIGDQFPGHAILGEEQGYAAGNGESPGGEMRWVLDPLDGTHNYIRGIPVWATLIACERRGTVEVGVVSAPAMGTRWWAGRGLGAYRGATEARSRAGERIHVSTRATLHEAQVLHGSYTLTLGAWGGRADGLLRAAWRQRGFGDFWQHCLVAEGAAEVSLEGEIKPWDIAAVQVIVEEAGGRLTDIDGAPRIDAGHCIVTNGALHDEVLRRLRGDLS